MVYSGAGDGSYFGFSGIRSIVAPLFARPEGATMEEVKDFTRKNGITTQVGFYRLLNKANDWRHKTVCWDDPERGKVFKLIYSEDHIATRATTPPKNLDELNVCNNPPGAEISE
ncbi:MAG: hypothetical protein GY697_25580 [Desulfobacterales bacterium]|nr:hypothetical protein [Desulfobacterales bacterium]